MATAMQPGSDGSGRAGRAGQAGRSGGSQRAVRDGRGPVGRSPVRRSLVRRCGPLAITAASFLFVAGSIAMTSLPAAVIGCVVAAVVLPVLIGRAPAGMPRFSWWRLVPGLLAVLSVAWSNWLLADPRSVEDAVVNGLRVGFFVIPGSVLAGYVDPFALGDQLGERLRLPARPVIALVVALGRADTLAEDWQVLVRTRRIRGLAHDGFVGRARDYALTTLELLVGAIRQAGETTVAMQARGYSAPLTTGRRRTWAEPAPWVGADTLVVVICVVLAAVPGAVTLLGVGR